MVSERAKGTGKRGRTPSPRPDPARVQRARDQLNSAGLTVEAWAAANGEQVGSVYKVLRGERACTHGQSHRIAVKLGIKDAGPPPAPVHPGAAMGRGVLEPAR